MLHRSLSSCGISCLKRYPQVVVGARFSSTAPKISNRFADKYDRNQNKRPAKGNTKDGKFPSKSQNAPNRTQSEYTSNAQRSDRPQRIGRPQNDRSQSDRLQRPDRTQRFAAREDNRFQKPQPRFENHTGSERARAAIASIVERARKYDPTLTVGFVEPESGKITECHLSSIVNSLDLAEHGILLIGPKENETVPLVRRISSASMLKSYSDALAAAKQKELLESKGSRASYLVSMRVQAERKKSAVKTLLLAWSISVSDLNNQKKHEIVTRLKKDNSLVIHIEDKGSSRGVKKLAEKEEELLEAPSSLSRLDEEALEIEMKKRQRLYDTLSAILEECNCKFEVAGSMDSRMILKVSSKQPQIQKTQETKELSEKELKRQRKAERARELAQKAQQKKVDEDDIDSLYSFKIED